MLVRSGVIAGYLFILLAIGIAARRRALRTRDDYFLASRTLSTPILLLTMAATNFSAFTVFGFSGAGWQTGYAFYPIMAFGTGFMALSFVLIGRPVWQLGRTHGLTTPAQLVYHLTGSSTLRLVFFAVMTAFTLPYLAMQPMAAGYALEGLLGIPYFAGAVLVTGVMLAYTFLGGFRGVSWTDAFQGGAMLVLLLVAVVAIAGRLGGLPGAHRAVAAAHPSLFARPGLDGLYSPGVWFGYMLLWFLCDPMFPQLFQRFYAGRSLRGLSRSMVFYPLLTGVLFLLPITIGVLGRLAVPTLPAGATSDQILPILLRSHTPPVVESLVLTAALAALMSTLDSQLLTLSSMFTHDLIAPLRRDWASGGVGTGEVTVPPWIGKAFVVALAIAGLAIAWRPPATFLEIATETFTGLAVLFPTVVAVLYWRRTDAFSAVASIVIGEALVIAYHFNALPTFGTLPVVPVVLATTLVLVVGSYVRGRRRAKQSTPARRRPRARRWQASWAFLFGALFVAAHDIWNWGDARMSFAGYPWWVWRFAGLCVATAGLFWAFGRAIDLRGDGGAGPHETGSSPGREEIDDDRSVDSTAPEQR